MDRSTWIQRGARRLLAAACFAIAATIVVAQDEVDVASRPARARDRGADIDSVKRELEELRRKVDDLERGSDAREPRRARDEKAKAVLPDDWTKALKWRSIGPAGMGGRITAITVYEADPSTYWVATASGGLLKTTNNGVTFEHQFDHEATVSIGDAAVAPSDKNIVWVGTGESNPRNSVSYGDGVYKSTDGGKTWTNMGLKKSFQIGRIVIHPKNPDVVYVGALGRLYGRNEERGLYKTVDGGKNWERILGFDDKAGVIDISMSPVDPETLIAALWDRARDGFDSFVGKPLPPEGHDAYDPSHKWGEHAGFYKTTDGGKNFKRLTVGLPSSRFGRSDIDWYAKNPNIVYAIIDCEKIGMGPAVSQSWLGLSLENGEAGVEVTSVTAQGPAEKAGLTAGDIVLEVGGRAVKDYTEVQAAIRAKGFGESIAFRIRRGESAGVDITAVVGRRPLASLATAGATQNAYVGITGEEVPEGLRVATVADDGPADKAGVKEGDVLRTLDGEPVSTTEQLTELVRLKRVGDVVALGIGRGSESVDLSATLTERPQQAQGRGGPGGGQGGGRGPSFMGSHFGAFARDQEGGGAQIARVAADRSAEIAGLVDGDVVKECDGAEVKDSQALTEILGRRFEGDTVTLKIEREKKTLEIAVKLTPPEGQGLRPFGFQYAGQMPNVQNEQGPAAHEYGGIYKSTDGGESWTRINSLNPRPMYFSQIRVDPSDDRYLYVLGVSLHRSTNGGKTFTADAGNRVHADHHALWIDPRDGRHIITGCDGGFYASWDRTRTWEHLNHLALGQFYHVAVDSKRPYRVYGGLQDNGSWGGPSRVLNGSGILNEDWISIGGGDGFVCRVDPFDPDIVYSESQNGAMSRRNLRTGESAGIAPRPKRGVRYRFNWNTPFILSNHNPGIFYAAGNHVFRSLKRGDELKQISPEITRTGRGTATALAESPLNADVLWVGSDDGALSLSKDGGTTWTSVVEKIGLPGPRWVATIEASRFAEGRCYVAFDAHRSDDDQPYAYVTEDFGETWKSLRANLPWGSTRCLREDLKNENLLYCGTEFAAFASLDRGETWTKINNNLPTVAVHEFALHPTAGEVVVATHGRSLWVLDVTALRQMTAEAVNAEATLYAPNTVVRWRSEPSRGTGGGFQRFVGEAPPRGASIVYSLGEKAAKATIKIVDYTGRTVRELEANVEPGLHVTNWDLSARAAVPAGRGPGAQGARESAAAETPRTDSAPTGRRRPGGGNFRRGERGADTQPTTQPTTRSARPPELPAGGFGGRGGGRGVPLGTYRVILEVDGRTIEKSLKIEGDPTLPPDIAALVGLEEEELDDGEEEEVDR